MQAPIIHLYAGDHSPWAQSVMLFLEYKQLKFTCNQTADIKSIIHNRKTKNVSYFQIPVLHYNNIIISDSIKILKFIHEKHPLPKLNNDKITSLDEINLRRLFCCITNRTKGGTKEGLFKFFVKYGTKKDVPTSYISLFFRPMNAIYFAFVVTLASKRKFIQKIAKSFKDNIQTEDENIYYAKNTFIFGLKFFENKEKDLFMNDSDSHKQYPSLLDFALLGQFQMIYSGLSQECIPLTIKYFPSSKKWLNSMHTILPKYNRFYTKNNVIQANYFEQFVYWMGFTIGFFINALFAFIVLITRRRISSMYK